MPAGFCFTGFCGLCSLQGLWREGGHWCQYPSLTPRQKEEGGTERPPMGTLLFRMGILPAQFSGRWFYQCTHRGSSASHNGVYAATKQWVQGALQT